MLDASIVGYLGTQIHRRSRPTAMTPRAYTLGSNCCSRFTEWDRLMRYLDGGSIVGRSELAAVVSQVEAVELQPGQMKERKKERQAK